MGSFGQLAAQFDPDNRVRGHQFEPICKWFLENDPYYKSLFQHVWRWKEWPGRWSTPSAGRCSTSPC